MVQACCLLYYLVLGVACCCRGREEKWSKATFSDLWTALNLQAYAYYPKRIKQRPTRYVCYSDFILISWVDLYNINMLNFTKKYSWFVSKLLCLTHCKE